MSVREIQQVFINYQKGRIEFSQKIAELTKHPRNIESMSLFFLSVHSTSLHVILTTLAIAMMQHDTGVMELLRPLLLDPEPSVQQTAALALGRLANYSEELAERIVTSDILPQLVLSLSNENKYYRRSAAFVLRSVAKHNPRLAQAVVDSGAIESLVDCLSQFDYGVKEAAAWSLGNIAKHSADLAQAVVEHQCVPLLLLCVKEPEISLKKVAASTLSYICGHSSELAQAVVDAEGVPDIAPLIENPQVKRQACTCLANIAKHSVTLAEIVVDGEIFPKIFSLLNDPEDPIVRKNAATCIREIAKHTPELSAHIVNSGGLPAIVDYVKNAEGDNKLPGVMTLGFVAAFAETMAMSVIDARAIPPLCKALSGDTSDHVKAASAWVLGQIGRHSSDHAQRVAEANTFKMLLDVYFNPNSSEDLKTKSKRSLKAVIQKCLYLEALNPLLQENAPENILKHVVKQYAKVLPNDIDAKKKFVTSKGLAKLQKIRTEDEDLLETIKLINSCYPEEVVRYYSPGYDQELLEKIEGESLHS